VTGDLTVHGGSGVNVLNGNLQVRGGVEIGDNEIFGGNAGSSTYLKTGGAPWRIYDSANNRPMASFHEGGPITFENSVNGNVMLRMNNSNGSDVEIPNGDLDMNAPDANIRDINDIRFDGGTNNGSGLIIPDEGGGTLGVYNASGCGDCKVMTWHREDNRTEAYGDLTVDGGRAALKLTEGGDDHTYMEFYADTDAADTRSGYVGYGSTGTNDLTLNNEMSNGDIDFMTGGGNTLKLHSTSTVEVPNGNLNVSGNLKTYGSLSVGTEPGSGTDLHIENESEASVYLNGGNLDTASSKIAFSDNVGDTYPGAGVSIRYDTSNNKIVFRDEYNNNDRVELKRGGDVKVDDGNLNMSSNDIKNVGLSDVDMEYDGGDNRMEITSNGNTDICIGNC
jgi:hypothetical protein